MTWAIVAAVVLAYAVAAVVTYRLAYVRTYEETDGDDAHRVGMARMEASFEAAFSPVVLWWALLVRYGTPTPPSVAAQIAADAAKAQAEAAARLERDERANAVRLDQIERSLRIGPYKPDPLEEIPA